MDLKDNPSDSPSDRTGRGGESSAVPLGGWRDQVTGAAGFRAGRLVVAGGPQA